MIEAAQLQLWRLISPVLPIGGYAYSTGLEYAVEAGWVGDENEALQWISGVAEHAIASVDVALLSRSYAAWQAGDVQQVEYWNAMVSALRESKELQLEDRQLGQALTKLTQELHWAPTLPFDQSFALGFPTALARVCVAQGIPVRDAASGLLFIWCENQISAAMKLIPLGQTAGQRIFNQILLQLPLWVDTGLALRDDEIGMCAPALAIGSARHETQYSRLFRS